MLIKDWQFHSGYKCNKGNLKADMLKSNYVRLAFFTFVMLECYIIYAIFFSFDGIFILSL